MTVLSSSREHLTLSEESTDLMEDIYGNLLKGLNVPSHEITETNLK